MVDAAGTGADGAHAGAEPGLGKGVRTPVAHAGVEAGVAWAEAARATPSPHPPHPPIPPIPPPHSYHRRWVFGKLLTPRQVGNGAQ